MAISTTPANPRCGGACYIIPEKIVLSERFVSGSTGSAMQTWCSPDLFGFERVDGRQVVAGFDGGKMT
jgi:hypothetical protein